jgi:hypothetical protein
MTVENDGEQYEEEATPLTGLAYQILLSLSVFFNNLAKKFPKYDV